MKIRSDFVSNSSSCSFVIERTDGGIVEGLRLLAKTFKGDEIAYSVEEDINITLITRRKWNADILDFLGMEKETKDDRVDWLGKAYKPSPEDETYITVSFQDLIYLGGDNAVLDKIDSIKFLCEDSSAMGTFYLGLMYRFFERNECCPDPSCTEQDFLEESCFNEFARKLAMA